MRSIGWLGAISIGLVLSACGGGGANLRPGPMPAGGSFTGVWYSTEYGEMHLVQNGAAIQGRYAKDERKGTIHGEADGDLMTYEWVEMKAMVANRPQETRGHGYFRYVIKKENDEHRLEGKWGLGDDYESGGTWEAYKMKGREPDVSQGGDSGGGGSDFDDDDEGDDFGGDDDDDFL